MMIVVVVTSVVPLVVMAAAPMFMILRMIMCVFGGGCFLKMLLFLTGRFGSVVGMRIMRSSVRAWVGPGMVTVVRHELLKRRFPVLRRHVHARARARADHRRPGPVRLPSTSGDPEPVRERTFRNDRMIRR